MSSELTANRNDRVETSARLSGRSEFRTLTGVDILATGSFVPSQKVTNDDLSQLGYDSDWIVQRTGIQARRQLPATLATSDMAFAAAERCLDLIDADRDRIDLVVVATMTPDRPAPSTACQLQHRLGLKAAAMDLNAACAGFMYALTTAAQFVKNGAAREALVVGADTNTRIINPADRKTFPLFGDGAGAVLVGSASEDQGLLAYTLGAEGDGWDMLSIPGGGSREPMTLERLENGRQYIQMDGRSVFKWAVRLLSDSIGDGLAHANLSLDEIRMVFLHQANIRIMEAAAADLGIDRDRMWINLDQYGNTSAGSIPLGLDEAHRGGHIQRGDKVLLCGFGAGLAWGTAILQW